MVEAYSPPFVMLEADVYKLEAVYVPVKLVAVPLVDKPTCSNLLVLVDIYEFK